MPDHLQISIARLVGELEHLDRATMYLQNNKFVSCDDETLQMFGYTDQKLFCTLHPKDISPALQASGVNSKDAANRRIAIAMHEGSHRFNWVHSRKDGSPFDAEVRLTKVSIDGKPALKATVTDISGYNLAQTKLEHRLDMERALATVSKHLLIHGSDCLNEVLGVLGNAVGVCRAYIFELHQDNILLMSNTYEWCKSGVNPQIDHLKEIETNVFPWWIEQIANNHTITISSVNQMPAIAAAEKEILQAQNIKSLLAVPLNDSNNTAIGFLGFDETANIREWHKDDIRALRITAEIISSTLLRDRLNANMERAHRALATSQSSLLAAQKIARIGNWEFFGSGFNSAALSGEALNILGITCVAEPQQIPVNDIFALVHEEDLPRLKTIRTSLRDQPPFKNEPIRFIKTDGTLVHTLLCADVLHHPHTHKITRLYGTIQDVTERVLFETMALEVAQARASSQAKSDFLAIMSHELRTPLHGIIGLQELLSTEADYLQPNHRHYLDLAQHSSSLLQSLISDILDISKIENGVEKITCAEFSLPLFLRQLLIPFYLKSQEKGLRLTLFQDEIPEQVKGDQSHLRQVLLNIIGNAIKFTSKGYIEILATYDKHTLTITITDTGIGISEKDLTLLFEPFVQFSTTADRNGAGLGTTIAKKLTLAMGGNITATSEVEKGTVFTVSIPLEALSEKRHRGYLELPPPILKEDRIHHFPEDTPETHAAYFTDILKLQSNSTHSDKSPPLKYPKSPAITMSLLLVEDDTIGRTIAEDIFGQAGFNLTSTDNGSDAWKILQENDFDILLTDIRMPGIDGIELTKLIRKQECNSTHKTYICGLSAHALDIIAEEALAAGMDQFIAKPISPLQLLHKITDRSSTIDE